MRAIEDREVMYHMMRTKPDDELHLRVYLPRRVLHYAWTKIAKDYPLVIELEAEGTKRLANLANREEGPMRLPVVRS